MKAFNKTKIGIVFGVRGMKLSPSLSGQKTPKPTEKCMTAFLYRINLAGSSYALVPCLYIKNHSSFCY